MIFASPMFGNANEPVSTKFQQTENHKNAITLHSIIVHLCSSCNHDKATIKVDRTLNIANQDTFEQYEHHFV